MFKNKIKIISNLAKHAGGKKKKKMIFFLLQYQKVNIISQSKSINFPRFVRFGNK